MIILALSNCVGQRLAPRRLRLDLCCLGQHELDQLSCR
jgi:hypothetical protein